MSSLLVVTGHSYVVLSKWAGSLQDKPGTKKEQKKNKRAS